MMDDTDDSDVPFKFNTINDKILLESVAYDGKKEKLEVSAGIYEAVKVEGKRTDYWKQVVTTEVEGFQCFLTLHTLQERLSDPDLRRDDSVALKKDAKAPLFELWSPAGFQEYIPTTLILRSSTRSQQYNSNLDRDQLAVWRTVATTLGGKPSGNPMYLRFLLKPLDPLREEAGDKLVYCSPAQSPVLGVDKNKLEAIVAAHTGKFHGWPDPVVIDYDEAERMGLRLVGRNFLQLYFTWMKAEYYEKLWEDLKPGLTGLLHAFPTEDKEQDYEDVNEKKLFGKKAGGVVATTSTTIFSKSPGKRGPLKPIMGDTAKAVATQLWGDNYLTSGMGKDVKVEWLHRVAHSLGGAEAFQNIVFGTWECNTDMIRAENFIKELTQKSDTKTYEGILTTINRTPNQLSRHDTLQDTDTNATIPTWAGKYSWLCFSLDYQYEMKAEKSPLGGPVVCKNDFNPWSIYVPLSMEPLLDSKILHDLKSGDSTLTTHKTFVVSTRNPQSLPDTSVPEPDNDGYQTLAWKAAINGLPLLELPNIVVKNPAVASPSVPDKVPTDDTISGHSDHSIPVDTPVPKDGFVLKGEVDLFRTRVVGNLEKWMGPAPENITIETEFPLIERVVISGDFHLSSLIPLLHGTPFDDIIFRNVAFSNQNYPFDKTKSVGWHFDADWVIDSSCGLLYDILRTALCVDRPTLSVRAAFGTMLQWTVPLNLHSFIIEGFFPRLTLSPISGLTLTSIGVRLLGIRGFSFTPKPHTTLSYGFAVFGKMKLGVPGSIVPLNLDYEMGFVAKTVDLRAEISGSIWQDALGVEGLVLNNVAFWTSFSATSPWKTFAFDVAATFYYLSSVAYFQGTYAASGQFSLMAELDNFTISKLSDLFYTIFGDFLTLPDFDVHVESAVISIASGQGLSMSLLDVNIAGYTSASLEVSLSASGAMLSGKLSSSEITFGDVGLRGASIKLSFWTTGRKKNVDFMLGGTLDVEFLNLTLGAVVHLYPGEDGVEWAVVAELSAPSRPISVSYLVPAVKGSFVDFSLSNAVFIAASKDDLTIGQSFPGYQIRKGVQVFGMIAHIKVLDCLLREEIKGLVFNATWSKDSGFSLFVSLPAAASIDLGNGIKTTPIAVGIRTNPPELAISAGVTIPIQDSTPITFNFVLAANAVEANASAQMQGWWDHPFGVDNLKIGPEVTLSIGIIYVQFVATGTPSEFGVSGGLKIGSTEAFLAMNASEDPKRQMLFGKLEKLDISDVVAFAGTLVQADIPHIPDNLIKFEELKVYICPFGVVLGQTVYPPGFSFKADLLFFNKKGDIECTIDKVQKLVDIIGGIDNFQLGPLTVRGLKGPRAKLECHLGVSKQQLVIDGVVTLLDMEAQTHVNIQFLPEPTFQFHLLLQFAKVFMYQLDAMLLGSIYDQLADMDFALSSELQNDILEYIAQQIIEQIKAVEVAAEQGVDAAQTKVNEAETQWEELVADARKKLEAAQKVWESYEARIKNANQPIIDWFNGEVARLQGELDKARKAYQDAVDDAQRKVNQSEQDRSSAMTAAESYVEQVQRDMNTAIDEAQKILDAAESVLSTAFGAAEQAIDDAEAEVDKLRGKINDLEKTIQEYEDAPWYRLDLKAQIPLLWADVGVFEGLKWAADLVLDEARDVLKGTEYLEKEGAVNTARAELERVRSTWNSTLERAKTALSTIDGNTQGAVDIAEAELERVKLGTEYYALQAAQYALDTFKNINTPSFERAMAAIEGMVNSAEYAAYKAAQAVLDAAEGSTEMLDAAKEALRHVKEELAHVSSIVEKVLGFGAKAVNIESIILSGTLRGIIGAGGSQSRPLSAEIKGYIIGQWFDIQANFDLKGPAAFVTAIFKKLWEIIHGPDDQPTNDDKKPPSSPTGDDHPPFKKKKKWPGKRQQKDWPPYDDDYDPLFVQGMHAARVKQGPDVLGMLTEKSESMLVDIPRGPFSGSPVVPSQVVVNRALVLMQEARGLSIYDGLNNM